MSIIISKAEKGDLESVLQIEKKSFSEPWSADSFLSALSMPFVHFVCIRLDEKVVGYAIFSLLFEQAEIQNVAVAPEMRRCGYGDALIDYVCDFCREKKGETVFLEVREGNSSARALYSKHGFVAFGKRANYYSSPREDAILMKKILP